MNRTSSTQSHQTITTIFLWNLNLPAMAQNSSKSILPSCSLSAQSRVLFTTCCSCSSFRLLPTIILSTWESSSVDMKPSPSISQTEKANQRKFSLTVHPKNSRLSLLVSSSSQKRPTPFKNSLKSMSPLSVYGACMDHAVCVQCTVGFVRVTLLSTTKYAATGFWAPFGPQISNHKGFFLLVEVVLAFQIFNFFTSANFSNLAKSKVFLESFQAILR